jgi:transcriptional regulator with XRE-family HTH domain
MKLDLDRLGQNVRDRRTARGWSLGDLADKTGLSKAYLSDLENGRGGRPNVQYLMQVASTFGATIDDLVSGTSDPAPSAGTAAAGEDDALPQGLREFAEKKGLRPEEISMLAQLHFRGGRPRDAEAWGAIFQVLKAVSGTGSN